MTFKVRRSKESDRDLELIFDHLVESYVALGDSRENAMDRAGDRVRRIENNFLGLAKTPFQGTLRPEITPGLRNVTKDGAVIYFTVHEALQEIRILALFFGGQDHQRHMLKRLSV